MRAPPLSVMPNHVIGAVIAGGHDARGIVARWCRELRAKGRRDDVREVLRWTTWIGYPGKERTKPSGGCPGCRGAS